MFLYVFAIAARRFSLVLQMYFFLISSMTYNQNLIIIDNGVTRFMLVHICSLSIKQSFHVDYTYFPVLSFKMLHVLL